MFQTKKIVLSLLLILSITSVFGVKILFNNRPLYLNTYNLALQDPTIKPYIKKEKQDYIFYFNLKPRNIYTYLSKTMPNTSLTKEIGTFMGMFNMGGHYIRDIIITNKVQTGYNLYTKGRIIQIPVRKESIQFDLIKQKLSTGVNYIYTCISSYIPPSSYKQEIHYDNQIPFKHAFCSAPIKIYFYKNNIFLDKDKYLQYKNLLDDKINFYEKHKLDLIKKMLISQKLPSLLDHIENDIKDYVVNKYNPGTNKIQKALLLSNLEKYLINKYSIYNGRIIIPNILAKDMIDFISTYYFDKYTKPIDQAYQQKLEQTKQYKQEALSNYNNLKQEYEDLKQNYEQLKQQYEQYKLKTAENRQKAIKLTIVLTKILSKYHDKETKLKLLDKINQIIETKYGPDKFKNQDLIGYVKDYIKIIRLAIQLSN